MYPEDEPERFKWFSQYCATDVLGEQELDHTLPDLTPRQKTMFVLDMRMNDRGIPIDVPLVAKALKVVTELEIDLHAKVVALTGGVTATQLVKFNNVLFDHDVVLPNLQAETVRLELKRDDLDPVARTLLELRTESGRASTKKLDSMMWCADPIDHVVQGSFLYHGAHTGRYAGRLVQPHNFIRGNLKPRQMATVFDLLGHADADLFKLMYDKPIDTIGQCMRGFIRAPKGKEFVIADYTAIEARVLAWVAGEEHMLQAYRQNLDVYKLMAIRLYACTMEDVADEQRRIAKNLVLGCGYQLGGPGFVLYAAGAGVALTEEFATRAVKAYRAGHPRIVESWRTVDQLFAAAVMNPEETFTGLKCKFNMVEQWLCVTLPSGRQLRYPYAQCVPGEKWGKPANMLSYRTEINGQFLKEKTYGGKLIENIVQAIAFDIMQEGMLSAETNGYPVVGTVHDEVLTLRTIGAGSAKELEDLVCSIPSWSKGIPLAAKGFVCERYRKD